MRHMLFSDVPTHEVVILIKDRALKTKAMQEAYIDPLANRGIDPCRITAFSLEYTSANKAPMSVIKPCIEATLKALVHLNTETLYVCDAAYFKKLAGVTQADSNYGYVFKCAIKGYEHLNVIYGTNHQQLFRDPAMQAKLDMSLSTLSRYTQGTYVEPGTNIIHSAEYPVLMEEVLLTLDSLHQHDMLTCDIETYGLDFWKADIGTISFAWNQHEGVAFAVDFSNNAQKARLVKQVLIQFFKKYKGKLIYHNGNFDIKVIIYVLFMRNMLDHKGMLYGIDIMTKNFGDTKLITYLATNTTAGNKLGLKEIAHAFAGNYAQSDIKDITKMKPEILLEYNLVDCLSTWYAYNKNYPIMVKDGQLEVYEKIFLPSVKVILQMELVGMPLDMSQVQRVDKKLRKIRDNAHLALFAMPLVNNFQELLRKEEFIQQNLLWKVKKMPVEHFDYITFNPNSDTQLQKFIYDELGYTVIDKTKGGAPATGGKTLKKLLLVSKCKEHTAMFKKMIELSEVNIIINTFIHAFLTKSVCKSDGVYYLHGNFNIGGTVSGRLSSSKPNMQNIPSTGSTYAKDIKSCFKAPPGWLFVGADFASLEDRISALTTKDPNKIKVYTDGYDGHCLRAFSYFGDRMPNIIDTVASINSIADLYPDFRQDSKAPTFLLTYQGTHHGLVQNCGITFAEAVDIENKYHELYKVSDQWVQDQLVQATYDGYVTVAFGMRVRTPVLAQTVLNTRVTPYEAQGEARTAGNALGQSYGLLNNRAGIEFQERTLASQYALDIMPAAHIHDAQYFLVRNTVGAMQWLNTNLVECMQWQDLPELKHDHVKLGGDVEIYYPNWAHKQSLPNGASIQEIYDLCLNK